MKTVIIAAAPVTKEKFHPVYEEFPISDKTLLECIGSCRATDEVLKAACIMLGMDASTCVAGMYYRLPDRENRPFELFMMDLRKRYMDARSDIIRRHEAELNKRRQELFHAVMTL